MSISKIFKFPAKLKVIILWIFFCNKLEINANYAPKLLLVAFDGFRWDYMNYVDMPNFKKVVSLGSKAPYMQGVYPSLTMPALFSIATGLHVESHGITGNSIYDPVLNESIAFGSMFSGKFNYAVDDSVWYKNTEPIWITTAKHGLRSGCFFWPGIEAKIQGYRPNFWIPFNSSIPFNNRVDTAMEWFTKEDVDLVLLYFPEPDLTAHKTGPAPQSNETIKIIQKCDKAMGYLLDQLQKHGLMDQVNMIVVSDHGTAALPVPNKYIDVYDYVNKSDVENFVAGGITPVKGKTNKVYNLLKDAHPHLKVYKKEDIPDRFHFKNNRRIPLIVAMPDEGWRLTTDSSYHKDMKGTHGYDNALPSMRPFFMAMGPNIKRNNPAPIVRQVDIYSLMCELLKLPPAQTNGSLHTIGQILRDPFFDQDDTFLKPSVLIVLAGFSAICTLLVVAIAFVYIRHCNGFYFTNSKDGHGDYVALS